MNTSVFDPRSLRLPDTYELVRLGYVAHLQNGLTVDAKRDVTGDVVTRPYLRVANVQAGSLSLESVTEITVPRSVARRSTLRPGDVLMTEGGDLDKLGRGTVWQGELEGCLHQNHIFVIRPDPQRLNGRYLAYLTQSLYGRCYFESTGTRTTNLASTNSNKIQSFPLPLPPLEEQRRIIEYLDAETIRIDHLVSLFTKQRDLVNERERAALPLIVGGALLGGGQMQSGVPWFPKVHPEALLVPLVRVLQLQRGVDLTESERRSGGIPVFTTAGHAGWHDKAIASGPGVIIGRYGSVGNVHWTEQPYWPHNTTLYVKNFDGNNERYCYHLLRALPYEMEQARAAVPGVNRNDLHKQLVPLLPRPLQLSASKQADEQMSWLKATHTRIERAKALLTERRQALITAAVTGQFDVSTASGRGVDVA
ncbi:restriction endonuclease subunit S [Streptomyces sp. NBC_00487]|uniref:restriction endonuclease subunit S n=1 Tax=unclassified Streptomyces TaxID=2593676 RepID=UPI002E17B50D|nr:MULTISPECIES: restriction endonuclease subunit S [unclassified Streptomyces]